MLQTDWLCLGDGLWIPQIDELSVPDPIAAPAGGGVAQGRLYVLGGTDEFQVAPNPLVRWPAAELPEPADAGPDAGPDAGADAGIDAGSDTEPDASSGEPDAAAGIDAGTPADDSTDGGCCRVAPGRPRDGALLLLALLGCGIAARRRGARSS